MKKLSSSIALALMVILSSCNKENDQDPVPSKTYAQLLKQSSWNFESTRYTVEVNDTVVADSTEQMVGVATFYNDNTVVTDFPGDESDTSSYMLNGNQIVIDELCFTILRLDESNFDIESLEYEEMGGVNGIYVTTRIFMNR